MEVAKLAQDVNELEKDQRAVDAEQPKKNREKDIPAG